jgi:hypothetical protein
MELKIILDLSAVARLWRWCTGTRRGRIASTLALTLTPVLVYAASITKPYTFTDGTIISASQVNANFDPLYTAVNDLQGGMAPIGSIIAWHKSLSGTPVLPAGWLECNGQRVSDPASPYNGVNLPNLNGDNRFLRGNTSSGATGGSTTHTHSFSQTSSDYAPDASHFTDGSLTNPANHLPPYFDIAWIIRIK